MLSVSTDVPVRNSSTSFNGQQDATVTEGAPSTGFSALIDSNNAEATASNIAGQLGAPTSGQVASTETAGVVSDAVPSATASQTSGTTGKTADTNADSAGVIGQQPRTGTAGTLTRTTGWKPLQTALAQDAAAANGLVPTRPGRTGASNDNTSSRHTVRSGSATVGANTQQQPVVALGTPVTAIQPQTQLSTVPTLSQDGGADVSQTTTAAAASQVASAPGAIAVAAANRVAADISGTTPPAQTTATGGTVATQPVVQLGSAPQVTGQVQTATTQSLDTTAIDTGIQVQTDATTQQTTTSSQQPAATTGTPQVLPAALQNLSSASAGESRADTDVASETPTPDFDGVPAANGQRGQPAATSNASRRTANTQPQSQNASDNVARTDTSPDATQAVTSAPEQHAGAGGQSPSAADSLGNSLANALNGQTNSPPPAATADTTALANTTSTNAPLNTTNLTMVTGAPVPISGLAVEISANARLGNTRFEIRLDPPDLGRIDVRLDVDRTGQVTSRLFVDKPETLDMLRRDAPQLQQALQDAGLKTGDNTLQFSLRDQGQQGRPNFASGQNPQQLVVAEDDSIAPETAGRSYGRQSAGSSGVDIRV